MRTKELVWTKEFAYAVGLFVSDGHLSIDGRHIDFTSKDCQLVETFSKVLGLSNTITRKSRSNEEEKKYFHIAFSDVELYRFLQAINIPQQKSKQIQEIILPQNLFFDFLRGLVDGDGNICVYTHPQSRKEQLKIRIFSASKCFLEWLRAQIMLNGVEGGRIRLATRVWELTYPKRYALQLLELMYHSDRLPCLLRKYEIARSCLSKNKSFNQNRWQNRYTKKLI